MFEYDIIKPKERLLMNPKTLFVSGSPGKMRMHIMYVLCGTAFFMPLNLYLMEACIIVAIFMTAMYTWKFGTEIWQHMSLFWAALGYAVISFVSIINSPQPLFSFLNYLFTVAQYFLLYCMVVSFVRGERERRTLVCAFLAGAVCVALYGLFQYSTMLGLGNIEWVDSDAFPMLKRRMFSTLYNPNLLSAFLLMVLSVTASLSIWTGQKWHRVLYVGLFTLFLICLILTYSRGAWVSMGALIFFFGLVWDKRVWLLFLAAPVILVFYHGGVVDRFLSIFFHSDADTSVAMRLAMWESTYYMICDHPWLGVGWGAYKFVYPEYNYYILEGAHIIIYHAHNMYLDIMAETGVTGFLFYMWFFFGNGWQAMRFLSRKHPPFAQCTAMGLAAVICTLAICGVSDHDLFSTQISLCFWLLCAIFANTYIEFRENSTNSLRNNSQ